MEYSTRQIGDKKFIDCSENCPIKDERTALDIVGICGEEGTDRVLLHSGNLPADFFRLSSGLAGNILLKFSNYWIKAAAILTHSKSARVNFVNLPWRQTGVTSSASFTPGKKLRNGLLVNERLKTIRIS
jgi:hypothetical protein